MKKFKMIKMGLGFSLLLGIFLLTGCGGDAGIGNWDAPPDNTDRLVTSISVTPAALSIPIDGVQQFTATATYDDGTSGEVTASSSWTSASPEVSTVALTTGLATGVTSGTSDITASFGDQTSTVTLTVTAATLTSLEVTPAITSLPVSGTLQLSARATYSDGSSQIVTSAPATVWTTANFPAGGPAVAGISASGLATGQVVGSADISATFGGQTATATLTVTAATLTSLQVTPALTSIPVSGTRQFIVRGTYSDGSVLILTSAPTTLWTAVNVPAGGSAVAGISASGLATGQAVGSADISATFGGQTATATLTVTAATLTSLQVTPALTSVPVNGTRQFIARGTYSDGSTLILTSAPTTVWTAVNVPAGGSAVAGISASGLATGQLVGSSDITAAFGGQSATATLNVDAIPLVTIIPGAFCPVADGPNIPTVTLSDPTSDNLFVTTSTAGVTNSGKLLTASFSLAMDAATIESATAPMTFSLIEAVSLNTVAGTVALDATNKIATFTTDAALLPDTDYTASISTDAMSAAGIAISCPYAWDFTTVTPAAVGIGPVNFGAAATFGSASTAGIVNVGATTVNGDVVLDPLAECNAVTVGSAGLIGQCNGIAPTINGVVISPLYPDAGVTSGKVVLDLRAAYIALSPAQMSTGVTTLAAGTTMGAGAGTGPVLNDNLFYPGIYKTTSGGMLITGDLTLDGQGDSNAVFVFQSDSSIGTASTGAADPHTRILLTNGAKASNVFWWVGSNQATLGSYTIFQGNLLSYSSITMETGASSCGRLFAGASTDGAFTFGENIVSVPGNLNAPAGCE